MRLVYIPVFCLLGLLTACSTPHYIPFTQELRYAEGLSEADLQRLQYYICPPLKMARAVEVTEKNINDGRLIRRQQQNLEEVVVPAWTPGIALQNSEHHLTVSFEEGSYFHFGVEQGKSSGYYTPLGREFEGLFKIPYGSKLYDMDLSESYECESDNYTQPRLWIDAASLNNKTHQRKVLQGLRAQ
ncbi:MAG: hypothetical protein K6L60_08465 [Oceanobacter sp.]|jgi:hypothetical protein